MKTRDKILVASLVLFNTEGEPNVTTVDIANELDISPGNLYYHFKGKEQIIAELFSVFEAEMTDILRAPSENVISAEDVWFYVYVVFEQLWNHRYFYRNLNDILQRYPAIDKKFRRLTKLKKTSAATVLEDLRDNHVIIIDDDEIDRLADNIALNLTFWLNFTQLQQNKMSDKLMMHKGVFQIVSMVASRFEEPYKIFYDESREIYRRLTEEAV